MFKCLELLLEDEQVCGASLHKAEGHVEIKYAYTSTLACTHTHFYARNHIKSLLDSGLRLFIPLKVCVTFYMYNK